MTWIALLSLLAWAVVAQVNLHLNRRDFNRERESYCSRIDALTEALVHDTGKQLQLRFKSSTTATDILRTKANSAFAHLRESRIATPPKETRKDNN